MVIFMGAVWVYDLLFLFLGPNLSEEERAQFAAEVDEFERPRKSVKNHLTYEAC